MKRILFLSFLVACTLSSVAQKDTSFLPDTVELLPVEVRAVRANATAPFAKTNVGKTEISKLNTGQDLPFLLNQTPSVVVNSDAGNGVGYTGIRIRGSDASRINVTLNGVPFNDAESGGTFFVNLPDFVSSVNSIQIQRGVGSSSNGPGAFGGSINLSTNELVTKPYVELNNNFGSFHTFKNTLKAGTGLIGKHFTADGRVSTINSNGYVDRAKSRLSSFYFSTAYLSDKTTIRLNAFAGKERTYQAWNGVSESDLKENRTINYAGMERPGEPYDDETDNYTQQNYQAFFTQKLTSKLVFNTGLFYVKGRGYYEQYKAGESYDDYNLVKPVYGPDTIFTTDLVRQLWLDNDFYGDVFSVQYNAGTTQLTIGGALSQYKGKHFGQVVWAEKGLGIDNRWYDVSATKNDFNLYTKWQQDITPTFQTYIDLQYRKIDYTLNGFRYNPTPHIDKNYNFFNPKAGLSYHKNNLTVFASYSIANKEPNRDDFEAGTNEQPKREHLNDIEAGIEQRGKNFSWGATLYYMKYKDQLVLTGKINDVGAYTRTNIKDSYRAGIELQGSATILPWLSTAANIALSRNRVNGFTEYLDDYDNGGQQTIEYAEGNLSFSPSIVGGATIIIKPLKNLEFGLISKYVSQQYLDNTSNKDRMLDAYFTEDIRAIYTFRAKRLKNVTVSAQVNNIFNNLYEPNGYTYSYYSNNRVETENYYFPMAGINWVFGLNIKL